MKKTMAWIAGIAAIVFFVNIAGCPAQQEAGRTPSPSVEYVPPGAINNNNYIDTSKRYVNTNSKTDVENYLHGLGF
ncbi:hypothetical protein FACS1894137_04480 [Spirochaetia bacterium]|nr:hypothetical protein FACS1894137_04480 [Spirochaetia bacterium]